MSEPYEIFVLICHEVSADRAVNVTHEALLEAGGQLDDDSVLYLNDTDDVEPEPEPVVHTRQALDTLATWPTLGTIDYAMPEGMVSVTFEGQRLGSVQAIIISILPRSFDQGGDEATIRYQKISALLHQELDASRTIMDWGLDYRGFRWFEEIERLNQGVFSGEYGLIDLKNQA